MTVANDRLNAALAAVRVCNLPSAIRELNSWSLEAGGTRVPLQAVAGAVFDEIDVWDPDEPIDELGVRIASDSTWVPDFDADFYGALVNAARGALEEVAGLPVEVVTVAYLVILDWLQAHPEEPARPRHPR